MHDAAACTSWPVSVDKIICLVNDTALPGYRAEHGLSFFIEAKCLRMLFDSGQSGDVLLHNARLSGLDFGWLGLIVLSHGHYDHTGGLAKALSASGLLKLVAHEAALRKKFLLTEGKTKEIGIPFSEKELWQDCDVVVRNGPFNICGGLWTTGEVPRVTPFETPSPRFVEERGGTMQTDPIPDDLSLVVQTPDGLMLICGCCHAGIVNTLEHVKKTFGSYPEIVSGGLHMESADDARIAATLGFLMAAGVRKAILGHCTGQKFMDVLAAAGIETIPLKAGMKIL